ncbi:MAG TPA: AAA family ATPase [Nostocaceae cyanobacterium]|nr:AAA family ATPase [Nostocaceae cyanobacterium]
MLKRIYIDNFRTLVNFELNFDSINLFLGNNGSGKSTVFDVLQKIQTFVSGDKKLEGIFKLDDCTRWQKNPLQKFELEIDGNGGIYKYKLGIEINENDKRQILISYENLYYNEQALFKKNDDKAIIYSDDFSVISDFPFSLRQSILTLITSDFNKTKITWFKERLERLFIIQVLPYEMVDDSKQEETKLTSKMENFVSWYRYISQDQGKITELIPILQEVLEGFVSFKFEKLSAEHRSLILRFSSEDDTKNIIDYRLSELSDGQKTLLALYTLLYCIKSEDYALCIDEPENFLALPEIQPWLMQLHDFCLERKLQALLISHHPEFMNYLVAANAAYWFECESNAPTRVRKISNEEAEDTGLKISELIARGWIYDQV